jgi:chromosome segregation ATPase
MRCLSQTYQPQPEKRVKSEHSLDELARQFEELRTENQDMRETINLLKEESRELRNQNQIFLQNSQMAMTKAHELQVWCTLYGSIVALVL